MRIAGEAREHRVAVLVEHGVLVRLLEAEHDSTPAHGHMFMLKNLWFSTERMGQTAALTSCQQE